MRSQVDDAQEKKMNQKKSRISAGAPTRRTVLRGLVAGTVAGLAMTIGGSFSDEASAADPAAEKIAAHFSSVKTMTGEFVQFGPTGQQTGGKFFIERPGKLRFNYEDPSLCNFLHRLL